MDIPAELRRETKAIEAEHRRAMRTIRDLVARVLDPATNADPSVKHEVLLSGLDRRRFLRIGGVSVLGASVLGACGDDDSDTGSTTPTTAAAAKQSATDIAILRTASSLERVAVAVYDKALGGLLTDAALVETARLFRDQHQDHAALLEGATKEAGGTPFTQPNPAVMQSLQPRIDGLRSQNDALVLARDLEGVAAATYQANVGSFTDLKLNATAMAVGGVEARHLALLNSVLRQSANGTAFQRTEGAVAAGTGV